MYEFTCVRCNCEFKINREQYKQKIRQKTKLHFCSNKCRQGYPVKPVTSKTLSCKTCGSMVTRRLYEYKKAEYCFCSRSCVAKHYSRHKTYGYKRSKFERHLEEYLTLHCPSLEVLYNTKHIIKDELDVYIPVLNLAIEINGIFHYKPIYGDQQLAKVQNVDQRKHQACITQQIDLRIIDVTPLNIFTPLGAKPYIQQIMNIINSKLTDRSRERSNLQHPHYRCGALPVELQDHMRWQGIEP